MALFLSPSCGERSSVGARDAFLRTTQASLLCALGVALLVACSQSRSTFRVSVQTQDFRVLVFNKGLKLLGQRLFATHSCSPLTHWIGEVGRLPSACCGEAFGTRPRRLG